MESGRDEDLLKKEMVVVCGSKMPNMCDVKERRRKGHIVHSECLAELDNVPY